MTRIYSVGYEGFELGAFAEHLSALGVKVLVDVRLNAVSRRPGFSKKKLAAALNAVGVDYVHERELGNPQDNRDAFKRGDGSEGIRRMRKILSNGAGPALQRVVDLAKTETIAVMCVERDRSQCHRDVVTTMMNELAPDLEVRQVL